MLCSIVIVGESTAPGSGIFFCLCGRGIVILLSSIISGPGEARSLLEVQGSRGSTDNGVLKEDEFWLEKATVSGNFWPQNLL